MECHYRTPDKLNGYRCCHDQVRFAFVTLRHCEKCELRDDTETALADRKERATKKFNAKGCRSCRPFVERLAEWFPT